MTIHSEPYNEDLETIPANTWTRVGSVVPAGMHRCISITFSTALADVVSLHVGPAAPSVNPSLRNSVDVDDGGGLSIFPRFILAGQAVWVKSVSGHGSVNLNGLEESN